MKWKELHKIGITGSRKFKGLSYVVIFMERYLRRNFESLDDVVIVTGGALGVDSAIEALCFRQGIKFLCIPGRWLELERAAGPIRNKHIVDLSNEMLAFWDGESPGTKQCIEYAQQVQKPLEIYTVKRLKREVGPLLPEVPVIKVPPKASSKDAHKMRDLVASADIGNFFDKPKKKKKKFKWRDA